MPGMMVKLTSSAATTPPKRLQHAIESQKILTHLETSFTAVPFVNLRTSFFHRSPTAPARPMGMKIIITITAKP